MPTNDPPDYYTMAPGLDLFAWLGTLPLPSLPADRILPVWGLFTTGFRYARRCLWKGQDIHAMAEDARKAAACFLRLAQVLEGSQAPAAIPVPMGTPPMAERYGVNGGYSRLDWTVETSHAASAPPAVPQTIRYDQLSESNRDFVRRVGESGSRFYYVMHSQAIVHVPQDEGLHPTIVTRLADGHWRQVVGWPGGEDVCPSA